MDMFAKQVASFTTFRVLVIGDFMLDQIICGDAVRLSPDAPVPVLRATDTRSVPGGAGNVAACLGALGGEAICVGVVGADEEGRILREALAARGCDVVGLLEAPGGRPTTVKRSLVGLAQRRHPQKMFRLDFESREPLPPEMVDAMLAEIDRRLDDVDVVCLEDYGKGVCEQPLCRAVIERCRSRGLTLLVDPALLDDFDRYRGATAITPNRTEARRVTGRLQEDDDGLGQAEAMARSLQEALDLEAVVLTLDRQGAVLAMRDGSVEHVPTQAREVYDVTGAGDMVLAAMACAVANGLAWSDAVRFANAAAGLEVESFGVHPVPLADVQRACLACGGLLEGKVRDLVALELELGARRAAGQRIVLTNGCFDVLHAGHVACLRGARALGDLLVVGVNVDAQVRAMKGEGRPVHGLSDRLEILAELQCVDLLVPFEEPTAHALIESIRPDVYAKGGDYAPGELNEHDLLQQLGIEVRILEHRPGRSSTTVIEAIAGR